VTTQPPPTAASVAMAAKASAMPSSIGRPCERKGAVGAREHEGQHRQDARAQDGEHTTQVGDDEEQHGVVLGKGR
jgi:hypothetical protein